VVHAHAILAAPIAADEAAADATTAAEPTGSDSMFNTVYSQGKPGKPHQ